MEEINLRDALSRDVWDYGSKTGRECRIIVMHPNTWRSMWDEVRTNSEWQLMNVKPNNMRLEFMGIKVVRSYDVAEGIFEIF